MYYNIQLDLNPKHLRCVLQGYYNFYAAAADQTCAARYPLCMNPPDMPITNNVGHFYFPIGDRTITDAILNSAVPYNIYVSLQLSVLDPAKKIIITNLFAKAPVTPNTIIKSCESLTAQVSLLSTTAVDIAVGFVGLQKDWNQSVVIYRVRPHTPKH